MNYSCCWVSPNLHALGCSPRNDEKYIRPKRTKNTDSLFKSSGIEKKRKILNVEKLAIP